MSEITAKVWRVQLPNAAQPPFRVFVNGVEQSEGTDYTVEGDHLRFTRPLAQEGKLGLGRWALMLFGVAGTYRKHDNVDLQYTVGGKTVLATALRVETPRNS